MGGSLIIISHQERILNIADRIIVISGGRIDRDGPPEKVIKELKFNGACKVIADKEGK